VTTTPTIDARPTKRMARRLVPAAVVAIVVTVVVGTAVLADDPPSGGPSTLGPGAVAVELRVVHSRFEPDRITVLAGTDVRFVVTNDDPINHELIIGDDDVHARHESGTEAAHPPVPGEVSVPALGSGTTSYRFDEPGRVLFACHLPGHFEYGMSGVVDVVEP
jgi:uncharacterized cupredoxin-like copper-binding protein